MAGEEGLSGKTVRKTRAQEELEAEHAPLLAPAIQRLGRLEESVELALQRLERLEQNAVQALQEFGALRDHLHHLANALGPIQQRVEVIYRQLVRKENGGE